MIGKLVYNLIQVTFVDVPNHDTGWVAKVAFHDAGFANDDASAGSISTEGELTTRYPVRNSSAGFGVRTAVDTIIRDLKALSVAPLPPVTLFITNNEDVELNRPWVTPGSSIPAEEIEEARKIATEYGFDFAGA